MKKCGNCSHSMKCEIADAVYCIGGFPQVFPMPDGNYRTVFPMMRVNGKCDQFMAGKTQDCITTPIPAKPKRGKK